ncbi:MAG: primosomal protein N' [Burkholderiaceae bacterium]
MTITKSGSDGFARVLLDVPIAAAFDYQVPADMADRVQPGSWVVVPWGKSRRVGIVSSLADVPEIAADRVRPLERTIDDAPVMPADWFGLGRFATGYYHRQPGEILLPVIPKLLRTVPREISASSTGRRQSTAFERARKNFRPEGEPSGVKSLPPLNTEQQEALNSLVGDAGFQVSLLHGVTGSGKTEVYLQWLATRLAADPKNQVLLLVPEIALTPQLAARVSERLAGAVAVLHSGMSEGERAAHWLAAVEGRARIIVGTRLSVLVPLSHLAGIVVDEEHDPSFKQQEAPHYSARDLAILRARECGVPVVLGSATPSLETWHAAHSGRYRYLSMPSRAGGAPLPTIHIESLRGISQAGQDANSALPEGLCQAAMDALTACLAAGDQTLVFINRRGYAPVLNCTNCGWLSECTNCSAYRVMHRSGGHSNYHLICHHCAAESPVPKRCPKCGDLNLRPLGRGTQRIEEILAEAFPAARVVRLDRDVAKRRGAADAVIDSIHRREVDIIVGTQMLAKGHDFERLNLVLVLDADGGLFASDFRAPERLFATLTQVAGRAGRHQKTQGAKVIVQTRFEEHAIFESLKNHDYTTFANHQLIERRDAGLPPFSFQGLLRIEARGLDQAIQFGREARLEALALQTAAHPELAKVSVYDPVPMPLARLAGRARAQLLIESTSRSELHRLIDIWQTALASRAGPVRWQIEIDPAQI